MEQVKESIKTIHLTEGNEFEVRFGEFIEGKFKPAINCKQFIDLNHFLTTNAKFQNVEFAFIVNHRNGVRVTQYLEGPNEDQLAYPWKGQKIIGENFITKTKVSGVDDNNYNIRFSVAKEEAVSDINCLHDPQNPAVYFKSRKRMTYIWDNTYKVEVSMFKASNDINLIEGSIMEYDVELELISNDNYNPDIVLEKVMAILKVLQDTDKVLSQKEILEVRKEYKKMMGPVIGCQPATLKKDRLTAKEYYVTLKYDGKRHMLFNNYLIDSKLNVKFLTETNLEGTILDGELYNGVYYAFDILFYENEDIRHLHFKERQEKLKAVCDKIPHLKMKEYYTLQEGIKRYNTYNGDIALDGVILVPTDKGYPLKNSSEEVPLKWKPEEFNTIDFKIKKLPENRWQLLCSNKDNTHTPFIYKGTDLSIINVSAMDNVNYIDNSIVECYYDRINETFKPTKTRYDKVKANYIGIAQDNFDTILNPFDLNELTRQQSVFYNMRRFHNWIKRNLLSRYATKSGQLLDLACGKGGDIYKWVDNNIRYVEGYDVNEESIKEARHRFEKVISKPTSKNFNYIFNVKDLSKELVETNTKFDIITSFFAIHYFYKDTDTLNHFVKHLEYVKDNGYFVVTTLCSEELEKINYTYKTENLQIQGKSENSIEVYIKDTVLDEATEEYLVDKDFTIEVMKRLNFELIETKLFDEYYPEWKKNQNFLSTQEQEYSFMNRVYVFRKKATNTNKEPVKRNSPKMNKEREAMLEQTSNQDNHKDKNNNNNTNLLNRPLKGKNAWTLKELKQYCIDKGIDSKGTKEQLIGKIKDTLKK